MTDQPNPPRIPLADLPELATRVGMQGVARHAEVGGAVCFGIIIALAAASIER